IETHGWHKGEMRGRDGSYCALGAIGVQTVRGHYELSMTTSAALERLADEIRPMTGPSDLDMPLEAVITWNDRIVQSKRHVVRVLRAAAVTASARQGEQE
ncbi:DUF6197 family protein, partial [Acinetobacter baumannii]|uniref:DUF6197 family protein n=1 Tax=Acinetobacter baumannii TaxID=470 RepID=UPI001C2E6250